MEKLANAYVSGLEDKNVVVSTVASKMLSGEVRILDLIQSLESSLTSSNTPKRVCACQLISSVLSKLPGSALTGNELESVMEFFCCRLQDHFSLQPVILDGFMWGSSCPQLSQECALSILQSVFKEIHTQSCLQMERYKIYLIITNILDYHPKAIEVMGKEFTYGFIQAVDGEQDPKNLILVFQLATSIIQFGCDLSGLVEELFEVTSCYFPIDFNPGKESPITNKDLVEGLRLVLSSTRLFAKYCIPLMLEKLESDLESAKMDSMITLTACLRKYFKSDLISFVSTIWDVVKKEITRSVSQDLEKQGLALLTQLVKNMSEWPVDNDDSTTVNMRSFVTDVINECLSHLKEPIHDRVKRVSSLIVEACAKASADAYKQVVDMVMPQLLPQAVLLQQEILNQGKESLPAMKISFEALVDAILSIMSICKSFTITNNPFAEFKEKMFDFFVTSLKHLPSVNLKCSSTSALAVLISFDVMTIEMVEDLAAVLLEMSLNLDEKSEVRSEVLLALSYLSSRHSLVVKRLVVGKLLRNVGEYFITGKKFEFIKLSLGCLAAVSVHMDTLKAVVPGIIRFIQRCKIEEAHSMFLLECLSCLQNISVSCLSDQSHADYLALNVTLPLIRYCMQASLEPKAPGLCCASCNSSDVGFSSECTSLPIFKSAATVVRNICQKLRPGGSADFVITFVSELFLDSDIGALELNPSSLMSLEPLNPEMYPLQTRTVCLLTASLCAFERSIHIPQADRLQDKLLDLSFNCPDQPTYVFASKAVACLMNKMQNEPAVVVSKVNFSRCLFFDNTTCEK